MAAVMRRADELFLLPFHCILALHLQHGFAWFLPGQVCPSFGLGYHQEKVLAFGRGPGIFRPWKENCTCGYPFRLCTTLWNLKQLRLECLYELVLVL